LGAIQNGYKNTLLLRKIEYLKHW